MSDALAHSRSLRRGTVDAETIKKLSADFRLTVLAKVAAEIVDEIESYDGDVFVHDGDLRVEGDFDTSDLAVAVLVVQGDLDVAGCYRDYDDPQSIVVVNGNLRARDVITAGFLDVSKNLEAANAIVGDYNDCNAAVIGGDVTCTMFYPEEHFFRIGGELRAKYLVGNVRHRVEARHFSPRALARSRRRRGAHRRRLRKFPRAEETRRIGQAR
ncbi:MAG TPA: hypothetical protein VGH28_19845 [Polyangiaceae bacterium]|jgi:hypothetical protein